MSKHPDYFLSPKQDHSRHPDYFPVRHMRLADYRSVHEPSNTQALCSHCPEFDGTNLCTDSCGPAFVWVDAATFVKLKLEEYV